MIQKNRIGKALKKHILSIMLALAMVIGTLPVMTTKAHAAEVGFNYLNESSQVVTGSGIVLGSGTTDWENGKTYVVNSNVTISTRVTVQGAAKLILLDGYTLTASAGISVDEGKELKIYAGKIGEGTIAGLGTVTASCSDQSAAIGGYGSYQNFHSNGTISIYGGTVKATSNGKGAAIGGAQGMTGGTVNIYGGTVTATSNLNSISCGAAIGGGDGGAGGTVNISGGEVIATSNGGAGIGGGRYARGGIVNITGGTVTATSNLNSQNNCGAAIGGGHGSAGGTVIISGGKVDATSEGGAGIGGGKDASGGTVNITGGTVTATATGGEGAFGIGRGGSAGNLGDGSFTVNDMVVYGGTTENPTEEIEPVDGEYERYRYMIVKPVVHGPQVNYRSFSESSSGIITTIEDTTIYNVVDRDTTTWKAGKTYVVNSNVEISERITVAGTSESPTKLILLDGCKLTASKGITVSDANRLEIYAGNLASAGTDIAGTGALEATESDSCKAGIGGLSYGDGGTIIIHGGTVTASGGRDAAGIGGGYFYGRGGTVIIYDGEVEATGGAGGAGIGGGDHGNGGVLTIYGGKITATGGSGGAGIGGGVEGSGADVTITGGTVTANGAEGAHGIGRGSSSGTAVDGEFTVGEGLAVYGDTTANPTEEIELENGEYARYRYMIVKPVVHGPQVNYRSFSESSSGITTTIYDTTIYNVVDGETTTWKAGKIYVVNDDVTISGRITVEGTAASEGQSATPGTGAKPTKLILLDGYTLTASKGITVAAGKQLEIYAGKLSSQTADIAGTGALVATGSDSGDAGIGGLSEYDSGTIIIYDGEVEATGSKGGAGIGGGYYYGDGGTVTIYGGKVTATGGSESDSGGAGIGGGVEGRGADVTVNGGTVIATGGEGAVGIGCGYSTDEGNQYGTLTVGEGLAVYGGDTNSELDELDGERKQYMKVTDPIPKAAVEYQVSSFSEGSGVTTETETTTSYKVVAAGTTTLKAGTTYVVNSNVEISERISVAGTSESPTKLILLDGYTLTASKGITVAADNQLEIYAGKLSSQTADIAGTGALVATGSYSGDAGIGGLSDSIGGTIIIHGGKVTAVGTTSYGGAAGIGGGADSAGGTVIIYDGAVEATGSKGGAGIGGGSWGPGGTVKIYGGKVTATGGSDSVSGGAGIGGGVDGRGGDVTVNGGTVITTGGEGAVGIGCGYSTGEGEYGTLTVGSNMVVYAGDTADQANEIDKVEGDYQRRKCMIIKPAHVHTWSITTNEGGDKVLIDCESEGCKYKKTSWYSYYHDCFEVSIYVETPMPLGQPIPIFISQSPNPNDVTWPSDIIVPTLDTVKYEGRNNTVYSKNTTPPTEAGDYTASAIVKVGDKEQVIKCDFTLKPAGASDGQVTHTHNWSIATNAAGNIALIKCDVTGCEYASASDNDVKFEVKISVESGLTAGKVSPAKITITPANGTFPTDIITIGKVTYKGRNNTEYTESTTAPSEAGDYTASVTVEIGEIKKVIKTDFTI
ncbi:MAG: hypothetical protein K6G81_01340, partial [Lachnospiraceae bacterium]|nr:hypothetical protein [Lachnospiraceae bacterium]